MDSSTKSGSSRLHLDSVFWLFFGEDCCCLRSAVTAMSAVAAVLCSVVSADPPGPVPCSESLGLNSLPDSLFFMHPVPKEVVTLTLVCSPPPSSAHLLTLALLAGGHPAMCASVSPLVLHSIAFFIQPGREHSARLALFILVLQSL